MATVSIDDIICTTGLMAPVSNDGIVHTFYYLLSYYVYYYNQHKIWI